VKDNATLVIVPASILETMNLGSTTGLVSLAKLQEMEKKRQQSGSGAEDLARANEEKKSPE